MGALRNHPARKSLTVAVAGQPNTGKSTLFNRLTGLNRAARSTREGRFVLREEENVIYSAAFYDSDWDCGLDETSLLEYFRTIQADWYSQ